MRKAKWLQNIQPYTRCWRGGRVAQWWMTNHSIVFFLAEIRDRVQFILPWLLARQIARQNLWVEVIQPPSRVKRPLLLPLQDWPPPSVPFKNGVSFWGSNMNFTYFHTIFYAEHNMEWFIWGPNTPLLYRLRLTHPCASLANASPCCRIPHHTVFNPPPYFISAATELV